MEGYGRLGSKFWVAPNKKNKQTVHVNINSWSPLHQEAPTQITHPYLQSFTHCFYMTRQKIMTDEQEAWLNERKPALLLANQRKAAAKEFFPTVVKEFREKWPVAQVSQAEINDAGSVELAERIKRDKYDKVDSSAIRMKGMIIKIHSAQVLGFITKPGL
jgi:hypothetical protein